MAKRNREDAATIGDLEDFAETVKTSFGDLAKAVTGKIVKAPDPKDDDKGDDGDADKGDDDKGDGFVPSSFGKLSKSWFGSQ